MIITKKKDIDEITESLGDRKDVYLMGCGSCAEQCNTGGVAEIKEMARTLTERGFNVRGGSVIDETCYRQLVLKEFRKEQDLKDAESILVLACGAGVKTVSEAADEKTPVIPALDSLFLASVERYGRFFEGCSLCGECLLSDTAGVCPHTECPKGLLNGPCGGVAEGKCEVNTDNTCAWVMIYKKLKAQDRLHLLKKVRPLKDHSGGKGPRSVLLRNPKGTTGLEQG
ncbi:MAG: methylenetetrahydrofolate reductase C-terminal domain-containing protein [Thermodesulfobacteriota bacterium]